MLWSSHSLLFCSWSSAAKIYNSDCSPCSQLVSDVALHSSTSAPSKRKSFQMKLLSMKKHTRERRWKNKARDQARKLEIGSAKGNFIFSDLSTCSRALLSTARLPSSLSTYRSHSDLRELLTDPLQSSWHWFLSLPT